MQKKNCKPQGEKCTEYAETSGKMCTFSKHPKHPLLAKKNSRCTHKKMKNCPKHAENMCQKYVLNIFDKNKCQKYALKICAKNM